MSNERAERALKEPPGPKRVTLIHRREADGYDFWMTAWSPPGSDTLCIADPIGQSCTAVEVIPPGTTVIGDADPYPRLVVVGEKGSRTLTATFADGSTTSVDFRAVPGVARTVAVIRYSNLVLGSTMVRLAPDGGPAVEWPLSPKPEGGVSQPNPSFAPSAAAPVDEATG